MLDITETENETLKSLAKLICDYFENAQVFLVDMLPEKTVGISKNVEAWCQITVYILLSCQVHDSE